MSDEKINLQQEMEIAELTKEVENLKHDLKKASKKKGKLLIKRFLLKTLQVCKKYSLNIISTLIITGGLCLIGFTPFKIDVTDQYLYKLDTTDSLGNHSVISQVEYDSDQPEFKVIKYGQWVKNKDGKYQRTIRSFSNTLYKQESIEEFLKLSDEELEEYFLHHSTEEIEERNEVSEEEANNPEYSEITLYYKDVTKKYKVTESKYKNIVKTFVYFLSLVSINSLCLTASLFNNTDLGYEFWAINQEYPDESKDIKRELKHKELQLKYKKNKL